MKKKPLAAALIAALAAEGIHYDAEAAKQYHLEQSEAPEPIPGGRANTWVTSTSTTPAVRFADIRQLFKR